MTAVIAVMTRPPDTKSAPLISGGTTQHQQYVQTAQGARAIARFGRKYDEFEAIQLTHVVAAALLLVSSFQARYKSNLPCLIAVFLVGNGYERAQIFGRDPGSDFFCPSGGKIVVAQQVMGTQTKLTSLLYIPPPPCSKFHPTEAPT